MDSLNPAKIEDMLEYVMKELDSMGKNPTIICEYNNGGYNLSVAGTNIYVSGPSFPEALMKVVEQLGGTTYFGLIINRKDI